MIDAYEIVEHSYDIVGRVLPSGKTGFDELLWRDIG